MKMIKVWFDSKGCSELIAEFRSVTLLRQCKSSLGKVAKLRGARIRYTQGELLQKSSKL